MGVLCRKENRFSGGDKERQKLSARGAPKKGNMSELNNNINSTLL